jgi:hypothetical protein
MTLRFIDAADNALAIHAHWLGEQAGGGVKITTDFGPEEVTGEDSDILMGLRKDRDISRLTVIKEAQRRGTISEEYDPDADFEQLVLEDAKLKPLQPQVPGTFDPSEKDGSEAPRAAGTTDDEPNVRPGDEE